jgi:hypothetical protein
VTGSRVTDAGLDKLHGLKGLRELTVTGSRVTEAGAARIRKALPELRLDP